MLVEETPQDISIDGAGYSLRISREEPTAELRLNGRHVATLSMASGLDALDRADVDTRLDPPTLAESAVGAQHAAPLYNVTWRGSSARWAVKQIDLLAWQDGFSYGYTVEGEGLIDRAHLLRTRSTASPAHSLRIFNPEPNSGRVQYPGGCCDPDKHCAICFPDRDSVADGYTRPPRFAGNPDFMTISVGSDKAYHDGNWFFTPAPFSYAVEGNGNWLAMGIAAEPGEWTFTDMDYPGGGFGFSLLYDGHARVNGSWRSPRLVCLPASDEYAAVQRYCDTLREWDLVPAHGRGSNGGHDEPASGDPGWWREPVFCGWGEQVSQEVHALDGVRAPARSTQANYERWLRALEARDINPGTVVIDDKWQRAYGLNDVDTSKWPDLPGFITRQRIAGRHVLLWLKAWDPEGVPPDECILDASGQPVAVDPGNPAFQERLAGQVRCMLRDLDAAGFKMDFTHLVPRGPQGSSAGGRWGLELMRQWLEIVSDAAREAKPDAMIVAHTANPYLADLVDVLRLNDVAGLLDGEASIVADMRHRARIARAASPYWLLDADNWPCASRAQLRDYIRAQASGEFGIPSLYHAERLGWKLTDESLKDEDYETIRAAWSSYRERLTRSRPLLESARNGP